jgi:Spy/CpxP family protein refolding chaperone
MDRIQRSMVILILSAISAGAQNVGCKPGPRALRPPGTADAFASMQVDSVFKGIALTDDQRKKAQAIVIAAGQQNISRSDSAYEQKHAAAMDERNTNLLALVAPDADKAKVTANIAEMATSPYRCDRPATKPPGDAARNL